MHTQQSSTDFKLRVLIYTDSLGIGGAEISLKHLITNVPDTVSLAIVGVNQDVIQYISADFPEAAQHILPKSGIQAWLTHQFMFKRLCPDIIHFNLCTPWAGAIGLSAALSLPRIRVVRVDQLPLRTTDTLTLWRTRALCLRVDAHVAVGEMSARRMEDFYALGRNSVISIPNGVPDRAIALSSSSNSKWPLVVGSIGRLDAMKAHDILLRAIAQVEGTRAVILGEGEQRPVLEKLAVELGIGDRVELPGWVNDPQVCLPQFDVVALPSRSEGFPLAMVEAMLAARPVIATRVGSMPEAVIADKTGIVIEKNDVTGLAQAIRQLRDNPTQRLQLGQQARQLALAHFTAETMTQSYETLWRQLVTAPRTPRLRVPRPKD